MAIKAACPWSSGVSIEDIYNRQQTNRQDIPRMSKMSNMSVYTYNSKVSTAPLHIPPPDGTHAKPLGATEETPSAHPLSFLRFYHQQNRRLSVVLALVALFLCLDIIVRSGPCFWFPYPLGAPFPPRLPPSPSDWPSRCSSELSFISDLTRLPGCSDTSARI
jgi:hypothetical protein